MRSNSENSPAALDTQFKGMKAGLGLSADQETDWSVFESAVRDAAKARLLALPTRVVMKRTLLATLAAAVLSASAFAQSDHPPPAQSGQKPAAQSDQKPVLLV